MMMMMFTPHEIATKSKQIKEEKEEEEYTYRIVLDVFFIRRILIVVKIN